MNFSNYDWTSRIICLTSYRSVLFFRILTTDILVLLIKKVKRVNSLKTSLKTGYRLVRQNE